MPNWIKNELTVYNLDLIGKTALEVAFGHDRPFQRLYPMPKILEETQSPTPRCLKKILGSLVLKKIPGNTDIQFYESSFRKSEWREKILELGMDETIRRIHEDDSIDKDEADKAELAIRAIVKTGYANWYDWCVDKWGVKWDTEKPQFQDSSLFENSEESEPELIISFYTPWAPPTGILKRISEQYPNAKFYLRWADESGSESSVGFFVAESGIINEKTIDDEKEFFYTLWEYSDEEKE